MMDMTAMSVVVARMIPSSVRRLLILLPRSESAATVAASANEALVAIGYIQQTRSGRRLFPDPLQQHPIEPESWETGREEAQVPAVLHGQEADALVLLYGGMAEHRKRDQRVVLCLHHECWHTNPVQKMYRRLSSVI